MPAGSVAGGALPPVVEAWLPALIFAASGLPLVAQDVRTTSVSRGLLIGVYAAWLATAFLLQGSTGRLAAGAAVLVIGSLLIAIMPDRLGEADVVFMSGMALLFPFWSLLFSLILGCIGALAAVAWLSRGGNQDVMVSPLPFLPSLYWGGLALAVGRAWW